MIKDPSSKYVLNSRLPSWIKFKPEYIDSMAENCDLLVIGKLFDIIYLFLKKSLKCSFDWKYIGAKYGSGKYGGILRQVLCAVRDDTIPLKDPPK